MPGITTRTDMAEKASALRLSQRVRKRRKETAMATRKTKRRNWYWGSSLDDWLKEEGWYEEFNAIREKERIARQLDLAMKKQRITKKPMAELMKTSRTQVDKLLNPKDGNVTIKTLHKAAAVIGKRFEYKLV